MSHSAMTLRAVCFVVTLMLFNADPLFGSVILFQDDFSGTSADLNGTTPDITQAGATWAADGAYNADGTVVDSQRTGTLNNYNARLALGNLINDNRGNEDAIYTLDATFEVTGDSGDSAKWQALGFFFEDSSKNFANGSVPGTSWMLRRYNNDIQAFLGPGNNGGLTETGAAPDDMAGEVDFQIELDLSAWDGVSDFGTATYRAKLSTGGTYHEMASGPLSDATDDFAYIVLGGGGVNANYSFFQLSQVGQAAVPEPTSVLLLAIGALGLGFARFRRRKV